MYIIEFEHYGPNTHKDATGAPARGVVVRVRTVNRLQPLAEAFYPDGLPDGLTLKSDAPFASLAIQESENS